MRATFAGIFLLTLSFAPIQTGAQEPTKKALLTIDDLPVADFDQRTPEERLETVSKLTQVLQKRNIPFVAFYNLQQHDKDKRLLPLWTALPLARAGNHTWSHPHPSKVGTKAYLEDLRKGHKAVQHLWKNKTTTIPYRHPYLHEGYPCKAQEAIRQTLRDLNSPEVPVTIDTWDWSYARRYEKALHKNDQKEAQFIVRNFLAHAHQSTVEAELLSQHLFGRQAPQIVLIHGNRLMADHLDDLLQQLTTRSYVFVTLEETLKDAAYQETDHSVSPIGTSRWSRLLRSRSNPKMCAP